VQPPRRAASGALVLTLLALRFLVELALFAAPVVIGASALGGVVGVGLGLVAFAVVVTVWGLLLSPKRRYDAPLGVRVALELGLMVAATAGLALTGHGGWALALLAAELVSVVALAALGLPPGSDVGATPPDAAAPHA
jgi:hypothetical protein